VGSGAGEGGASGASQGVKPGALTALLYEVAAAPGQREAEPPPLLPGAVVRFEIVRELNQSPECSHQTQDGGWNALPAGTHPTTTSIPPSTWRVSGPAPAQKAKAPPASTGEASALLAGPRGFEPLAFGFVDGPDHPGRRASQLGFPGKSWGLAMAEGTRSDREVTLGPPGLDTIWTRFGGVAFGLLVRWLPWRAGWRRRHVRAGAGPAAGRRGAVGSGLNAGEARGAGGRGAGAERVPVGEEARRGGAEERLCLIEVLLEELEARLAALERAAGVAG